MSARKLGFGINLQELIFNRAVHINKLYLTDALMNVQVSEKGEANYNIYKSDTAAKKDTAADHSAASLRLERIKISNCHLMYNDRSVRMLMEAKHLNYEGSGDLSRSIFDLASHIETDSFNFTFDKENYLAHKAIDADLITRVNTQTLALIFQKNDLKINQLALQFSGRLDFLRNGYDMDFNLNSGQADLAQFLTAFPPEYIDWLKKTTVNGRAGLSLSLKGKYIASANEMPDLGMKLNIRDGFIAYENVKLPISGLKANAEIQLLHLDPEKLHIKLDSFSFQLDKDFVQARWESQGLHSPEIDLEASAHLNLDNLKKAFGVNPFDLNGRLDLDAKAKGKYDVKIVSTSFRKKDTVIASIPSFHIRCEVKDGILRYPSLPEPVTRIFLKMQADCPDANYLHAIFRIDTLNAAVLNNYIRGKARINAEKDFPLEASLQGLINLSEIQKFYPLDSMNLSGLLQFNLNTQGKYAPTHHLFPKTSGQFLLENASVQTKYYPHPIEKINISVQARDDKGTLNDLHLQIPKASLTFEGKPFYFRGSFKNFDDIHYDIAAKADLDIGRIYQVFSKKDMDVSGIIRADVSFQGKQSDASAGRYELLKNTGTLEVKNLRLRHEYFPKPFLISRGRFHFEQDKMWFDQFLAEYGATDLRLDGFLENAINYALGGSRILSGNFNLNARYINLDEFAANPSGTGAASHAEDPVAGGPAIKGVIMIPANLNLVLKAEAEKISYDGITLDHFNGGVNISNAGIELTQTGFSLIGAQVNMSGKYHATSPVRAAFDYHLLAKDFDIHRAYQEIKMFRDLASSAQHAQGLISLDYSLSGKLNEEMHPVYPSLAGGGTLSIKNVKFNGWKLFNTVSSKTDKPGLKDPDLSKIDVKSTIKNNLITIERMKFRTGGFRIRFEGQTAFDNKINFKMRIGLPPLGIIGIPLRITGSSDAPKIKLGNKDNDPLEETQDND